MKLFRTLMFSALCAAGAGAQAAEPHEILVGGRIVTLAGDRVVQAMAVDQGRVLATGTDAEMRKLAGPGTRIVDLGGRMVLPGMIETHVHSLGAARRSLREDYQELYSIADVQNWIRNQARHTPEGHWIQVPRNEITRLAERRFPTPAELDAATTRHPVVFVSVTKTVLNSAGWKALGITDPGSRAAGGDVVFDNGRPALMRGGSAALRAKMPQPPAPEPAAVRARLQELYRIYNSVGITTIFERAINRPDFNLLRELAAQGELTARVRATFRFGAKTAADVRKYVEGLGLKPGEGDDMVRATWMKTTIDGGIHWGTTWLSEPYGEKRTAFYRNTDAAYTGEHYCTPEQMREIFGEVNRLGWPMSAHVTGDGGAMAVLRAIESVAATQPDIRSRRFNLLHCYFPDDAMVALAKKLGAGVDTQGYLYYRDADFIAKTYGEPWADRFMALAAWARGGVPVATNSDHMEGLDPDHAMNSFNPFLMLYIAVARKDDRGQVYGPHQKLDRLDALRATTLWGAWLSFDEDKIGSLEPGKLADYVVIDRDYLTCPEDEIRMIRPLRTVLGGRTIWERPAGARAAPAARGAGR